MSDDNLKEIYRNLYTSQDKYVYFILAATVAAIGFTITETKTLHLSCTQIPLGLSLLSWGLSFWFGCRNREYYNSTLFANGELVKIQKGQHPEVSNHPELIQAASEGVKKALISNSNKINMFGRLQTRFFIWGALLYIVWHTLEMYMLGAS